MNIAQYLNTPIGEIFKGQVAKYMIGGMGIDASVLKATNDINNLLLDGNFRNDVLDATMRQLKINGTI